MIFRGRPSDGAVSRRFRSSPDGFTFNRGEAGAYEAHVSANSERVVDLFYALSEHMSPAVDVVLDDRHREIIWAGDDVALPDLRDTIARLKVPLATYGGVEVTAFTPDDQLTLTAQLQLYAYARSDRWLYLLQGMGLEEFNSLAGRHWGSQPGGGSAAPALCEAVEAAAERLSLHRL